jgi:hypothetical protein
MAEAERDEVGAAGHDTTPPLSSSTVQGTSQNATTQQLSADWKYARTPPGSAAVHVPVNQLL